jgi:hypothetical protein
VWFGNASRVSGHGAWTYPSDDGTGARSNGGEDDAHGGENIGLAQKLLPVTWNPVLGRSIVYVRACPVTRADGSQGL